MSVSKPKLLLADDSITIQKVISLTFADKGMDVVAFSDGDAAIEHLDDERPDIVLADVHMPGINGYQVCELIRSNEGTKNTPVVLLVGSFEPFDRDEADRVGANTHLTKPFTSIADVISTVDGLLATRAEQVPQEPRPDTSDIDSLYEQSFVETMELPDKGTIEYEVDGYDDEMIQTSYAEPDLDTVVEESLYPVNGEDDLTIDTVDLDEVGAESLIAESLPETESPVEAAEEIEQNAGSTETLMAEPEPLVASADPFESVAAEPPPVEATEEPVQSPVKFSFEDTDLLELPGGSPSPPPTAYTAMANGREIVSLSPELIDLIVQKVVDRLEEKGRSDEARSMSGS